MHELSLVRSLLRHVDHVLVENRVENATTVEIGIGPLSGVEPELVRSAFERLTEPSNLKQTRLVITESLLVVKCLQCRSRSTLKNFVFRCDQCGSGRVQVVEGDEFRLLSVTVPEHTKPGSVPSDRTTTLPNEAR